MEYSIIRIVIEENDDKYIYALCEGNDIQKIKERYKKKAMRYNIYLEKLKTETNQLNIIRFNQYLDKQNNTTKLINGLITRYGFKFLRFELLRTLDDLALCKKILLYLRTKTTPLDYLNIEDIEFIEDEYIDVDIESFISVSSSYLRKQEKLVDDNKKEVIETIKIIPKTDLIKLNIIEDFDESQSKSSKSSGNTKNTFTLKIIEPPKVDENNKSLKIIEPPKVDEKKISNLKYLLETTEPKFNNFNNFN